MDDKRILALFFQRAETAISAVSVKYGAKLLRVANNLLHNHQDAEECVNDTYLALWNTIPPQCPNPLLTYASRITRNIAINRLRGSYAACRRSQYDVSLDELASCIGNASLEEEMDVRLLGQSINAFLGTLRQDQRNLFLRRYWFGDSVKDIAAAYSLSENTVSVRLNRIRSKLKAFLIQEGYHEE